MKAQHYSRCLKLSETNSHQLAIIHQSRIPPKIGKVIRDFENPKSDETIILVHWFDERPKIGIRLPFCSTNEVESRNSYTKWRFNFFVTWQTRKIESIFKLKDKNMHPSQVTYKGKCICRQTYIGETAHNLEVNVNEHLDVKKQSQPAKHIRKHSNHKFTWEVLIAAHSCSKRGIKKKLSTSHAFVQN